MTFDRALRIVLSEAPAPRGETAPIARVAGRVLARAVRADRDLPPFDRATLDGYAVRVRGRFGERQALPIAGEVAAGVAPPRSLALDTCVRIWTGAPVPSGAQGIVPIERAREADGRAILEGPFEAARARRPGIAPRGADARKGDVVLARGRRLAQPDLAVLASVGCARVPVFAEPEVAIVVTGHELVPADARPGPAQIRSANDRVVAELARAVGVASIREIGIAEDEPAPLRRALRRGLERDVLVVTGGVSAGRLDLVPGVLEELGVRIRLHKIAIRPGKPFLFGVRRQAGRRTAVFGLPGNPVSVLVTALEFLCPFLRAWRGEEVPAGGGVPVRLEAAIRRGGGLLHFVPCLVRVDRQGTLRAREIPSHGSGDFVSAARATAFLRVPGDGVTRRAGVRLRADLLPGIAPVAEGA